MKLYLIAFIALNILVAATAAFGAAAPEPKPAVAAKPKPALVIPADLELIKDVAYSPDANKLHKLDILRLKKLPKTAMPVLVWIHGGGFVGGAKADGYKHLMRFAKRGYLCASINYRFAYEKHFPGQLEDCKCAIRFLRAHAKQYNLDADHIGVWGASAGGNLVAMLGTTGGVKEFEGTGGWEKFSSRVQAVVDYYGMTDFNAINELVKQGKATQRFMDRSGKDSVSHLLGVEKWWENPELCRKASPTTYVSKDDPPFYIFHGDLDPLTNHEQGELLNERLRKAGVESDFYLVVGGKHGWPPRKDVDSKVDAFLDKHLRKKS